MKENKGFGARFRAIRKELRLTQKQFAAKLGVVQTTISSLERSVNSPKGHVITKLISLGVRPDYISKGTLPILETKQVANPSSISPAQDQKHLLEKIEDLKKIIALKDELIDLLRKNK
jgi:transcriptional regulator with XRE-family HTH domain